jgi:hypothetical protein
VRDTVREMRVTGQSPGKIGVSVPGVKSENYISHGGMARKSGASWPRSPRPAKAADATLHAHSPGGKDPLTRPKLGSSVQYWQMQRGLSFFNDPTKG